MSWELLSTFESAEKIRSQTSFYWPFGKTQVISIRQESFSFVPFKKSNTVRPLLSTTNKIPGKSANAAHELAQKVNPNATERKLVRRPSSPKFRAAWPGGSMVRQPDRILPLRMLHPSAQRSSTAV